MLKSVRQTGVWPNAIIKYIQGIAPATVTDPGCPKPPLATDNLSCLSKLECPLCCEILSQPIELPCSVLACAECIIAWLKISGTVLCPCCYSDIPMAPASLRPASDLIISLLHDILVHCTSCGRDMRAGAYVGHQCTRSPTRSEVNMAADILRHVISNSPPDECVVKVPTGGRVKCFITFWPHIYYITATEFIYSQSHSCVWCKPILQPQLHVQSHSMGVVERCTKLGMLLVVENLLHFYTRRQAPCLVERIKWL